MGPENREKLIALLIAYRRFMDYSVTDAIEEAARAEALADAVIDLGNAMEEG